MERKVPNHRGVNMVQLQKIITNLEKVGKVTKISEVIQNFPGTSPFEIEAALLRLEKEGAAVVDFDSKEISLIGEKVQMPNKAITEQLAYTFPVAYNYSGKSLTTEVAIRTLFSGAKAHVRIVSPYIDTTTITLFQRELSMIASNNVRLSLLTRLDTRDLKLIKSLIMLIGIFRAHGKISNLTIYTLNQELRAMSGSYLQFAALHAKAIISDDNSCYIGSANLTEHSLTSNFELGAYITNKLRVQEIIDVFNHIVRLGRCIVSNELEKLIKN